MSLIKHAMGSAFIILLVANACGKKHGSFEEKIMKKEACWQYISYDQLVRNNLDTTCIPCIEFNSDNTCQSVFMVDKQIESIISIEGPSEKTMIWKYNNSDSVLSLHDRTFKIRKITDDTIFMQGKSAGLDILVRMN
jgi:hypothetical protein